jgi:hypothetical protein
MDAGRAPDQPGGEPAVTTVRLRVSFMGRFSQASAPIGAGLPAGGSRGAQKGGSPPPRLPPSHLPPPHLSLQGEGGAWRYLGGDHFLESLPDTTRYSDLMFSLAEKVDGAVSVKYQLPGEELDPDSLISVNDDNDMKVGGRCRRGGAARACLLLGQHAVVVLPEHWKPPAGWCRPLLAQSSAAPRPRLPQPPIRSRHRLLPFLPPSF